MKDNKEFETKHFYLYIICFFILGLFNNLGYVLVWVSSSDLSASLNAPNMVTLYLFSMQLFGTIVRIIHMNFCIQIGYKLKVLIVSVFNFIGFLTFYIILATTDKTSTESLNRSFYLSIIPSVMIGSVCTLGEVVMVGYLKKFPSHWLVGFTSGTGLAGVTGPAVTIIFKLSGINVDLMWLILSISGPLYFGAYYLAEKTFKNEFKIHRKNTANKIMTEIDQKSVNSEVNLIEENLEPNLENKLQVENTADNNDLEDHEEDLDEEGELDDRSNRKKSIIEEIVTKENTKNESFSCENLKKCSGLAGYYIYNIGLSYFFSYNVVHFCERYEKFKWIDTENVSIFYFNFNFNHNILLFL
jgi:hypothetical protein